MASARIALISRIATLTVSALLWSGAGMAALQSGETSPAEREDWTAERTSMTAKVVKVQAPGENEPNLGLLSGEVPIFREEGPDEESFYVIVPLKVPAVGWRLSVSGLDVPLPPKPTDPTSVAIYLHSVKSVVVVGALSPQGDEFSQSLEILLPGELSKKLKPQDQTNPLPQLVVKIQRPVHPQDRLPELVVDSLDLPMRFLDRRQDSKPFVTLSGSYARPGWKLFAKKNDTEKSEQKSPLIFGERAGADASFRFSILILEADFKLTLVALGPKGERIKEELRILVPPALLARVLKMQKKPRLSEVTLLVGVAGHRYFQRTYGDFKSIASWLSGSYERKPDAASRWSFRLDAASTIFTLSSQPAGYGPQVIRADLTALRRLSAEPEARWVVSGLAGLGYLTILSNGTPFGFANLVTAELGLQLAWRISPKRQIIARARYEPAGDGIGGLFSLSDRGLDLGLELRLGYAEKTPWVVGFRLSDTRYKPSKSDNIVLTAAAISFGLAL